MSATSDVVEAALVLCATDGDEIVTSEAGDLAPLAEMWGLHIELVDPRAGEGRARTAEASAV